MYRRIRPAALGALVATALAAASCSENGAVSPVAAFSPITSTRDVSVAALPAVRLSEIHYDNVGTDADERIEISGPAGMDLTGWQVVLYNGNGGASYGTAQMLSGPIPATCDTRGVLVLAYAVNGIQNGGAGTATTEPDGVALVDASGTVVEFLSYEGVFAATNGPAVGMTSVDIGVRELGSEPLGQSLQRSGADVWSGPSANTFGACNDAVTQPPAVVASVTVAPASASVAAGATQAFTATALDASNQPIAGVAFTWSSSAPAVATVSQTGIATAVQPGDATITATAPNAIAGSASLRVDPASTPGLPATRFSELHYDNFGTDAGEAIEIEGPAGTSLAGWSVVLYNGNGGGSYNAQTLSGTIPASCTGRGVVVVTYPQDGIQNGSPDGMALVDAGGEVVEFLSYEGTFTATNGPASGRASVDIGVAESSSPVGQSLQRTAAGAWQAPAASSFGACNGTGGTPGGNSITFSGRTPGDPPLPVGFQDQIFGTVRDGTGAVVATALTWASVTPQIVSIDQNGVITALAAGTATVRATTADGLTTATYSLPTRVAVASTTAQYAGNAEFGEPADGDASDDFILRYAQYTASFNQNRGTPNWVSYDLEATHFGTEDRCDCFTFEPSLPATFTRYTTADYTGAGAFAGYGIDRGHLARSFDRTSASLDNAFTYYFSNIVPQAADLNQGPWAAMENFLGDLARLQNKEVYIVTGVAGNKGTVKGEGKIVIPAFTWKVAVVMARDQGLANVDDLTDLEVIAAVMPNEPGVRGVSWETYKTTIDAVEALSGYDLLALLRDDIEVAVESGTRPPVATINGPYAGQEGSPVSFTAAGSSDADGDALTYSWSFGDGSTAGGLGTTHTYAQDGTYTVTLTVTDTRGLFDTKTTTATVANVAPAIAPFAGATLLPGETFSSSGAFTDPGADPWSATVDYGDGSGTSALALTGKTFSLSHAYSVAGIYTVTVRIADDDVTSSRTANVTVLTPARAVGNAIALVDALVADGKISSGTANSLVTKLDGAMKLLASDNTNAATGKLGSLLNELEALVRSGRVAPADVDALRDLVERVIAAIAPDGIGVRVE